MAANATRHAGNGSRLRHGVEVADGSMTGFALFPGFHMLAMGPSSPRQHLVDAHPGNRLSRIGIRRELHDRRAVGGYRCVTFHAGGGGWERHLLTWSRVGMTELAGQSHTDMRLVTVWQRLL